MFKQSHKEIIICILLFISILAYFIFNIRLQTVLFFLVLILSFYFSERIFSFNFEKQHYYYVVAISLSMLFFYYIQLQFVYIDKILHLIGGIMLASIMYHISTKIKVIKNYQLLFTIISSLLIILGYEFYEYVSDFFLNTSMQGVYQRIGDETIVLIGSVADTLQDIVLGLLGVLGSFFVIQR